ncbi:MAG: F0F1 ATP synthase subunit delta [Sulfurovaceae bacterium]|nr:F0F1 ATP synthase subunit delta [Sulfurovaceae bacterium]
MFSWWTFFFQIVNFFIVLYILYRLFFNPLKRVIQTREDMISQRLQKLEDGEKHIKENEDLHRQSMKEIQNLRQKELDEARKKALIETDLLMKETEQEISKAFEKQSKIIEQQREKSEKEIRHKSLEFSLYYSGKMLTQLSDELINQKRIDQFLQALPTSDMKEITLLKEELAGKKCEILLYTPFNLQENTLVKIKESIGSLIQCDEVILHSIEDHSLIAGIRMIIGNKILDASVKGELERFKTQMQNEL